MINQSTIFEQPVNELMRVSLRLEHLLQFVQHGLRHTTIFDHHMAIAAIADILALSDRPDLRGKFTKEFSRQQANLQRFVHDEQIDQQKLTMTLGDIDKILQRLQNASGKFAASLRDNEFLTNIRQHLATPGGSCSFDTPAFYYWLQQPIKERQAHLVEWLAELEDLFTVIHFILRMVRHSGQAMTHTAHEGFYQASLDPQMPCQLIRVFVPHGTAFPEISVGRHGVSIRFFYPTTRERARPYEKDVSFRLSCCIL